MPNITKISHLPKLNKKKKVAAYCRVSSGKDAMLHSLSAQISYYNELIQKERDWNFVGVYADEAITGTKESRIKFQQMLTDCRDGKIDIVITKSISRFARNTVTLLETVRLLKAYEVDIFFEEQNLHTMSSDGELMLTILASYAQEESRSASENQKWRIIKNFEEGKPWSWCIRGYKLIDGKYEIVPEDAAIIKRIFTEYLNGSGLAKIAHGLTEDGIPTEHGGIWRERTLAKILRNYNYTGNLLLQKTFREDHISKKTVKNEGQLPRYLVENSHEAIIPLEMFEATQREIERRAKLMAPEPAKPKTYPYTGLIVCAKCGKNYRRKINHSIVVWICATYNTLGKKYCASKQIPESILDDLISEITDSIENISKIVADDGNTIHFHFKDGRVVTRIWEDRSRSKSWTPEMREQARNKLIGRSRNNGKSSNSNTGNKE